MQRIYAVWQRLVKVLPLHRKRVTIKPEYVIGIHLPDCRLESLVERGQPVVLRIARLVDRVVAGHPWVVLVTRRDLLPKPDGAILVVLVVPEGGVVGRVVRVPVAVLTAGNSVHVEDGVDLVLGTLFSQSC